MSDEADLSIMYSGAVDDVLPAPDASQQPPSLEVIYDLAIAAGVESSSLVVDAGCATGERARELMHRTGYRVDGVELVPQLIGMGRGGYAERRVRFVEVGRHVQILSSAVDEFIGAGTVQAWGIAAGMSGGPRNYGNIRRRASGN